MAEDLTVCSVHTQGNYLDNFHGVAYVNSTPVLCVTEEIELENFELHLIFYRKMLNGNCQFSSTLICDKLNQPNKRVAFLEHFSL